MNFISYVHLYKQFEGPTVYNRDVEAQLWHVSYAHILTRNMGHSVQTHDRTAYRCRYTKHCRKYIRQLFRNDKDSLVYTGK